MQQVEIRHEQLFATDWKAATGAIQAGIDRVVAAGGGRVSVMPGNYVVGAIQLKTGVQLNLAEDACLIACEQGDFPSPSWKRIIWADEATDVALTGAGTIDCRGRFEQREAPPPPPLLATTYVGGYYRNLDSPRPVFFHGCRQVRVEGVRLANSGEWGCYVLCCDQVLIDGVTIRHTAHSTWSDGIDLESCRNVVVQNCDVQTGDDAISIKTAKRGRQQTSHNILIRDCTLASETNGIKFGCEIGLDLSNVRVEHCLIRSHPDREAAGPFGGIAVQSVDGADVSNLQFSHIRIEDARAPIFLKLGRGGSYRENITTLSALRNITLEHITSRVTGAKAQPGITSSITGYEGHCIENVVLRDIDIEVPGGEIPDSGPVPDVVDRYMETPDLGVLPAYGLYARYVRNLTLERVRFRTQRPDSRPPICLESVAGVTDYPCSS